MRNTSTKQKARNSQKGRNVPIQISNSKSTIVDKTKMSSKNIARQDRKFNSINLARYQVYSLIPLYTYLAYLELQQRQDTAYLITSSVVLLFVLCVIIVGHSRKKYYYPGISELPDGIYWPTVGILQTTILAVYMYFTAKDNLTNVISLGYFLVVGMLTLSLYHTQSFSLRAIDKREERIQQLARKARLSKEELDAISTEITSNGISNEKQPITWTFYKAAIGFMIALIINTYAQPLLEFLSSIEW